MKKSKILVFIITLLMFIPYVNAEELTNKFIDTGYEEAAKTIGGNVGTGCLGAATGCRKPDGFGIKVSVCEIVGGIESCGPAKNYDSKKVKYENEKWIFEEYFNGLLEKFDDASLTDELDIQLKDMSDWANAINLSSLIKDIEKNCFKGETQICSEACDEKLQYFSKTLNNKYIKVEPTMTVSYGDENAWVGDTPYSKSQIENIKKAGKLPTDTQTLADAVRISTSGWKFNCNTENCKWIRETQLGIFDVEAAIQIHLDDEFWNRLTGTIQNKNNTWASHSQVKEALNYSAINPRWACTTSDCNTARTALNMSKYSYEQADLFYRSITGANTSIIGQFRTYIEGYNRLYDQLTKAKETIISGTAREIAKKFQELIDNGQLHAAGYYNNGTPVPASTSSNVGKISTYITMPKNVSLVSDLYTKVSGQATNWNWGSKGYGVAIFRGYTDIQGCDSSKHSCEFASSVLYDKDKAVAKPVNGEKHVCCELNDQEGNSLWLDPNDFEKFKKSSVYKEYCPTNKCVWNGTSTKKMQIQGSATLDCCDVNNYDINPTNQTGWNKWYTDTCQSVTYACTLDDLKNIKSSNDSKFNCCFNINEYSNAAKNTINSSGGLENYIKYKAKTDSSFKTVLGVCYPTTSCQVDTLILCPTCNSGDSDGSIADTVSYKTESTSIVELEYNTEMAKNCVIGNSNLLSFSNPYCKAYCGEQIEYDYPIYANTTVLAGGKITVGKNGTFSPITLTGTKKCFVESIASDIFKQNMNDINSSIAEKAKEINNLVEQINSVSKEPVTSNTCAYIYGSCGGSPHCEICSSMFEREYCQGIYDTGIEDANKCYEARGQIQEDCMEACRKDPTNLTLCDNCTKITNDCDLKQSQASQAYSSCSSAMKCNVENWSRYREYYYTEYSSNGTARKSFCENQDPRTSWNARLSTLREQYRKLVQTRNSYINAMNECMNIQNKIGYNEFDPQLSLDYISGKYSTMDIQLNNDISISSSGSIGTTPYNTISYDVYDENGKWNYSGTANYITLSASDINNHEFSITKTVNFYLGNNFSTYTYVDLSNGNSTGTSSDTSVYIGPHLPVQYDSIKASDNSITIKIDTLGNGNKFNSELNLNNDCKNYECSFNVYNNIINSKGLNVVYRPISLSNPFPEESGNGRLTGSNWCSNGDCKNTNNTVKTVITNNRGVTENEIYTMTPLYTIKLTPKDIINIRGYNLSHKYGDFNLKCTTDSTGYKCKSDYLRDSSWIIESKSCALGKGNNCRDNGKDVY